MGMTAWQAVLAVCGGIAALGAAATYIAKVIKPARDLLQRVDAQDRKLDADKKRLDELETGNRAVCRALIALLDHEITGNSVDRLRGARDALNQYLIER